MILFGVTKHAALEKDSSAYSLRNEKQLLCVWGDSKAWCNEQGSIKVRIFSFVRILETEHDGSMQEQAFYKLNT